MVAIKKGDILRHKGYGMQGPAIKVMKDEIGIRVPAFYEEELSGGSCKGDPDRSEIWGDPEDFELVRKKPVRVKKYKRRT